MEATREQREYAFWITAKEYDCNPAMAAIILESTSEPVLVMWNDFGDERLHRLWLVDGRWYVEDYLGVTDESVGDEVFTALVADIEGDWKLCLQTRRKPPKRRQPSQELNPFAPLTLSSPEAADRFRLN